MKTKAEYLQQAIDKTWFADYPQKQRDYCIKHYRAELQMSVAKMMFVDALSETWLMRQVYRLLNRFSKQKEAAQ